MVVPIHRLIIFLISSSLMSSVCRVVSLHLGSNLSDHVPLTLTLECSGQVVHAPTSSHICSMPGLV